MTQCEMCHNEIKRERDVQFFKMQEFRFVEVYDRKVESSSGITVLTVCPYCYQDLIKPYKDRIAKLKGIEALAYAQDQLRIAREEKGRHAKAAEMYIAAEASEKRLLEAIEDLRNKAAIERSKRE